MADAVDKASDYAQSANEAALAEHRARQRQPVGESADTCEECGCEIPSERQLASPGCTMCADCAGYWERVAAQRARGHAPPNV